MSRVARVEGALSKLLIGLSVTYHSQLPKYIERRFKENGLIHLRPEAEVNVKHHFNCSCIF